MKRLINIINVLLLLFIIFMCLFKIPFIDDFISLKIFPDEDTQSPEPGIIVRDREQEDVIYPVIAISDGRIDMMYKGRYVNLLPEDYKVDADSRKKIYDQLFSEGDLVFSDDGEKVAFILTVNKTAYLFLCDLEKGISVQVDEKVDSFALSPDGRTLFYATGYLYSNTLFLYSEGKKNYVAENISALYLSDNNAVVFRTKDGYLETYSVTDPQLRIIDKGVTALHRGDADGSYNYFAGCEKLTVFYEKASGLYSFTAGTVNNGVMENGIITKYADGFEQVAAYGSYKSDSGTVYRYYRDRGLLVKLSGGEEQKVRDRLDAVYFFDGRSVFVAASGNKLIRVQGDDLTETVLMDLGNKYKNAQELTENDLCVSSSDGKTFYVCALNDSTWIWNRMKSYSWINRISKYSYSAFVITVTGEGENAFAEVSNILFPASAGLYTAIPGNDGKIYFMIRPANEDISVLYSAEGDKFSEIARGDIKIMKAGDVICFALFSEDDVTVYSMSEVDVK